jgi:hypothetical protein
MVRLIESIIGALPYHCHGWSVRLDAAWPALERVFVRGRAVNSMSPRMCADVRGSTSLRLRPSPTGSVCFEGAMGRRQGEDHCPA